MPQRTHQRVRIVSPDIPQRWRIDIPEMIPQRIADRILEVSSESLFEIIQASPIICFRRFFRDHRGFPRYASESPRRLHQWIAKSFCRIPRRLLRDSSEDFSVDSSDIPPRDYPDDFPEEPSDSPVLNGCLQRFLIGFVRCCRDTAEMLHKVFQISSDFIQIFRRHSSEEVSRISQRFIRQT